jgi:branched-chain amino acid transport system substrate-binding protein
MAPRPGVLGNPWMPRDAGPLAWYVRTRGDGRRSTRHIGRCRRYVGGTGHLEIPVTEATAEVSKGVSVRKLAARVVTLMGAGSLVTAILLGVGPTRAASAVAGKRPILIGFVGDLTGLAASTFADGVGAAQARIDLQNAEGGVDGHKLELVVSDDQSSPGGFLTAVSDLVETKGVFGVVTDSAFVFGADTFLNERGIPVTGYGIDGPEWAEQPFTNMFDALPPTLGAIQGHFYTSSGGGFLKTFGVKKMASLAYGFSPSATQSAKNGIYANGLSGIANCYENLTVPFGSEDFTADVLQIQKDGCDAVTTAFVDSSDVALAQAIKNADLRLKVVLLSEGYDDNVLDSATARASVDGDYFDALIDFSKPNAGTKVMLNALTKYDHSYTKGGIPDLGIYGSYIGTDLMIFGLEHAGKNITRASFIKNLRKVSSYNAGGLLSSALTFQHFGTAGMLPKKTCSSFVVLKGAKFVSYDNGKVFCSTYIKVPSSA